MTTTRRSLLTALGATSLATGAVLTTTGSTRADAAPSGRIPDDLRPGGTFDKHVAELAAKDDFSGTIRLTYRDRTVLSRSYRMADKERSIPNEADTTFSLGSITKLFTGVAIGQLAQQGKLAYHEKLGRYLDGFPTETADTVTIHQLLTHRSGMGDFHSDEYFEESRTWDSADEVMNGTMTFVREAPLEFTPGTSYQYSNSGYVTLGAIVAELSGQSYYDYVRQHVFDPAGMTSSDFYTKPQWRTDPRIAHPYAEQPSGGHVDTLEERPFIGSPAGESFANAPDLVRFTKALLGNELLDPPYTHLTLGPKTPREPLQASDEPTRIAFDTYAPGAVLFDGQWILGHNGGAPGVSVNLDWFPDSDWVAIVLGNYDIRTSEPVVSMARELITQHYKDS